MPKIYTWVKRKFNFDHTAEMYMPLVERVSGTPARIEDRVKHLPDTILTKKMDAEV